MGSVCIAASLSCWLEHAVGTVPCTVSHLLGPWALMTTWNTPNSMHWHILICRKATVRLGLCRCMEMLGEWDDVLVVMDEEIKADPNQLFVDGAGLQYLR